MTCDELRPDYVLYAMGTLLEPELGEIRAHLARGCENCTPGVREAESLAFALGAAVEGPEPPRALRKRVLAAAGGEGENRFGWLAVIGAAAAMAVLVTAVATTNAARQARVSHAEVAQLRAEISRNATQTAALREALALIQSPDTREVNFGNGKPAPPRGRVFVHPTGVLLIASKLPPPPSGKTYEMWIIRGGKPAPAGLFGSDADGNAIHLFRPSSPAAPSDVVAVTLEPAGGVPQPTSTPLIVAPL